MLLQVEYSSQNLRDKQVCETNSPVDSELWKMQEAHVDVFSDSVLSMGKSAMKLPEIKNLEHYRDSTFFLATKRTR